MPYHNYSSDAVIVWGTADADWVRKAIKGPYTPLLDRDGKAQVALWCVEYKDTMLNPYKEYIIVFATVPAGRDVAPISYPHQQLQLFEDKLAFPYIYKLWLDKQLPVNYGRELLGCDKYLDRGMTLAFGSRSDGKLGFTVTTLTVEAHHVEGEINPAEATAGLLVKGTIDLTDSMHLGSLVGAFGMRRTLGMAAGVRGSWHVVNPPGIMARPDSERYNPVWTFWFETSPKFTTVSEDKLEYGGELKAMGFQAKLLQHDPSLRAVLLPPWTFTSMPDEPHRKCF